MQTQNALHRNRMIAISWALIMDLQGLHASMWVTVKKGHFALTERDLKRLQWTEANVLERFVQQKLTVLDFQLDRLKGQ